MVGDATSHDRYFPRKVRQVLCEILLDLPDMELPARRDYLLRQLTLEYPGFQGLPRDNDPHVDLMEIISAAYERPGALRAFADAVDYLYRGDPRLDQVNEFVDQYDPQTLLLTQERRAIVELIEADAAPDVVSAAFHHSVRTSVHQVDVEPEDVAAVARYVENRAIRPGRLPSFFEFIDFIAHSCANATKIQMHRWMDEVSTRLGRADRTDLDNLCLATENRLAGSGRTYLVALVRPDKLRPNWFFLAAWRQRENEPEEPLYTQDESVHSDQAMVIIRKILNYLVNDAASTVERPVIELILPRCLVTQSIDQWEIDDLLRSPVGTKLPLAVRSFDRLDDVSMRGSWGRNWRWIKQHDRRAGADAVRHVQSHDLSAVRALRAALVRDGPPTIALILTALPHSDALCVDAYSAGLDGGAPIMLWSRSDAHADALSESVREACRNSLLDLREHVFNLRLLALEEGGADTVGAHTVLVFDDFDRIPEQFRSRSRLQSPLRVEFS